MRVDVVIALSWLAMVPGCSDAPPAGEPPPVVTPAPLCLEALPPSLVFEGEHPGDARENTLLVATCDRSPWRARIALDGDGFVTSERLVARDGTVRARGRDLTLAAGEHVEVDVMFLSRTRDDGAEATLEVRGVGADGRVGAIGVSLAGVVLSTCAECACCDESTDDPLPTFGFHAYGDQESWRNSDAGCATCTETPKGPDGKP